MSSGVFVWGGVLLSGVNYPGVLSGRIPRKPQHETIIDHEIATPPSITIASVSNTLC